MTYAEPAARIGCGLLFVWAAGAGAGCVTPAGDSTVADPTLGVPALTSVELECDDGKAKWSATVKTDAWAGGATLYWSVDGAYVETHPLSSVKAAGDGSSDKLFVELSIVVDWREAEDGKTTAFTCAATPSALIEVTALSGEVTDCARFAWEPDLIGTVGSAIAATPPLTLGDDTVHIRRSGYCLPSGLHVVYHQRPDDVVATVTTVVGAGGAQDPPGKEGLAHLVEHLWFRSEQADGLAVRSLERETGAYANARTTPDETVYTTHSMMATLRALLALEGARLTTPLSGVTEDVFAIEREVVRSELRQRLENSDQIGTFGLYPRLFPGDHPYGRPIAGTHASLDAISLADARAFVDTHYRPDRTTLLVTAALPPDRFAVLLASELPPSLLAGDVACEPQPSTARAPAQPLGDAMIRSAVTDPFVVLGWSVPGGFSLGVVEQRATIALEIALYEHDASCWYDRGAVNGLIACRAPLTRDPDVLIPRLRGATQRLLDASDGDWLPWVNYYGTGLQRGALFAAIEGHAVDHPDAEFVHYTGRLDSLPLRVSQLADPSPSDLVRFSEAWLRPERSTALVVLPDHEASAAESRHTRQLDDADLVGGMSVSREAVLESVVAPTSDEITTVELANGLTAWLHPRAGSGFGHARLVMPGGYAHAPTAEVEVLRREFHDNLHGTTDDWPLIYLAPSIGGSWYTDTGHHALVYGLSASSDRLESAFYLLQQRVRQARVQISGKGKYADEVAAGARQRLRSAAAWRRSCSSGTWAWATSCSACSTRTASQACPRPTSGRGTSG